MGRKQFNNWPFFVLASAANIIALTYVYREIRSLNRRSDAHSMSIHALRSSEMIRTDLGGRSAERAPAHARV